VHADGSAVHVEFLKLVPVPELGFAGVNFGMGGDDFAVGIVEARGVVAGLPTADSIPPEKPKRREPRPDFGRVKWSSMASPLRVWTPGPWRDRERSEVAKGWPSEVDCRSEGRSQPGAGDLKRVEERIFGRIRVPPEGCDRISYLYTAGAYDNVDWKLVVAQAIE